MNLIKKAPKYTRVQTLKKVLAFIYGRYTLETIFRDILFLIITVAELYQILIIGKFLDSTFTLISNWNEFSFQEYFITDSFYYLMIVLIITAVVKIFTEVRVYLYTRIQEKIWADTDYEMINKVSESNLEDIETDDFQDLLTYVPFNSIANIITSYDAISEIVRNLIRVVSSVLILYQSLGLLSFALLFFAIPDVLYMQKNRNKVKDVQTEATEKFKFLNYLKQISLSSLSQFSELRVNGVFGYIKRSYKREYEKYNKKLLFRWLHFGEDRMLWTVVGEVLKTLYIVYLVGMAIIQKMTIGSFKALYDYIQVAYISAFDFLNTISLLANRLDYAEKYFEYINYDGFGDIEHGQVKLTNQTPEMEFYKLSFSYPDDPKTLVLKNISFKIKPGEKVAFFGVDGSGKSSLIKILTGLYQVSKGDYLIDGHSTKDLDRGELKKKLSITFQDFINYNFSIEHNIIVSGQKKNINRSLYEEVKKITEVDDFMKQEHLTDKQIIGKAFGDGRDISPGYWQRLAIARMLYRNKDIFVMDEPFTFIDGSSRDRILDRIIKFLGKDKTMIYVTSNTDVLDKFDKIYVLSGGRIVEEGTWKELIKAKGTLYKEAKYNI